MDLCHFPVQARFHPHSLLDPYQKNLEALESAFSRDHLHLSAALACRTSRLRIFPSHHSSFHLSYPTFYLSVLPRPSRDTVSLTPLASPVTALPASSSGESILSGTIMNGKEEEKSLEDATAAGEVNGEVTVRGQVIRVEMEGGRGHKIAGLLEDTGSTEIVVLCHGFRSSKSSATIVCMASALSSLGISTFRFDFTGNGESEGEFAFGNYWDEVEDLRAAVLFWRAKGRNVAGVIGHSKGGNIVVLYASKYSDVTSVVNVCGRFDLKRGLKERLGEKGLQEIISKGELSVKDSLGEYKVSRESIEERLAIDMEEAARKIPPTVRVLTVHGSSDSTIPVEDGTSFSSVISNQELVIIDGAEHNFRNHRKELGQAILPFFQERVKGQRPS